MLPRMWSHRNSHAWLVGMQSFPTSLEVLPVWHFFRKLNILLAQDAAAAVLGTRATQTFAAALFVIAIPGK